MHSKTREGVNVAQYLGDLAKRLDDAQHGGRGALVAEASAFLGWSEQRIYAQLKRRVAWSSGRKTRADKGATSQPLESLHAVGSMQRQSVRENGKQVLHLPTALSIARPNGEEKARPPPPFRPG